LKSRLLVTFALAVLTAASASAQTTSAPTTGNDGPDPSRVRVRIGPLWMNPTISIPNIGIDTNVFNEPLNAQPKRDFTMTVSPQTELWLRMGRTWLSGLIVENVNWYKKYSSERGVDSSYTVGWRAPLNRLVLATDATWLRTRSRPGFEIDARSRRQEPAYTASAEVRGFARTYIGVKGTWSSVRFDQGQFFQDVDLAAELDRTARSGAVTLRYELTPLTSVAVSAGRSEQRFKTEPSRNSSSDDYSIGLVFDPAALIKGNATIGYTRYNPEAADLPDFHGTTAAVGLSYTLLGSTRFAFDVKRGIEFSYDATQPYYLLTGVNGSLAQQIFGPFDVVGRASAERLHYRSVFDAIVVAPNRTDRVRSYGFGLGIHMGPELRLGFNVDKERRTSVEADRQYEGLKYGSSITYGLQ
jgi:hypothetical protein